MQKHHRTHALIILSDVNFSPQLTAVLQKLHDLGITFRVILIGDSDVIIGQQIKASRWNSRVIAKRGRLGSIYNLFLISEEILKIRPYVLFASGQFATAIGMLSSRLLNTPRRIFIRHHSNFHHKYHMRFGMLIDKMANYFSTEIIAVSDVVKNILISVESVNPEKIKLIHNGVEFERFQNINLDNAKSMHSNQNDCKMFKIGVISRLTELKGVEYIAQAFVKLNTEFPDTFLHIIGAYSDSYPEVSKILSTVGQGSFIIEEENNDIPNFFRSLNVFVHVPVGSQDEAFGIVYIEALVSGVECVFTQSGVLNELNDAQRYLTIVNPEDSEAIYSNLRKARLGISSKRIPIPEAWLSQFKLNKVANNYAELIIGTDKE